MANHSSKHSTPKSSPASSNLKSNSNGNSIKQIKKEDNNSPLLNNKPIKFNDEEVKRMHNELAKREKLQSATTTKKSTKSTSLIKKKKSTTFISFLTRVAIFYFLIAFYVVCPRDPELSRSVCRNLHSLQSTLHSYDPYVKPIYTSIGNQLNPYYQQIQSKVEPYVELVSPYYNQADNYLRPHITTGIKLYSNQIEPQLIKGINTAQEAVKPLLNSAYVQYKAILAPSIEWYTLAGQTWYETNVQKHFTLVDTTIRQNFNLAYDYVSPLYLEGLPIVQKHYYNTVKPFALTIQPLILKSYKISKKIYVEEVHPRLITGGSNSIQFYKSQVSPALQRFWSLYISPQVDEIRQKIFEYRTKKLETEAENEVKVLQEELKKELNVDDLEEFISELRETDSEVVEEVVESIPEPAVKASEREPTAEELLAATAEKRQALETLQTTYEKSIAKLGQVEHDLLVKRLKELRSNALLDIPKRFESLIEDLDGEGDKMVGRLQKYFSKVTEDEKLSLEDKVKDADFLSKKALSKVNKLADEILLEIENYKLNLAEKEGSSVKKAGEALSDIVSKAQEELGFGWTWLDDVKHSDWARFHKLSKAESTWSEYHSGVAFGTIVDEDLASLASPIALLEEIKSQVKSLVSSFESILSKITIKGQEELKGGAKVAVVEETSKVAEIVEDKAEAVVEPIQEVVQETVEDVVEAVQETVEVVVESVVEVVPEVPTIPEVVEPITSIVEEVVESVTSIIEEITTTASSSSSVVVESISSIVSVAKEVVTEAVEAIIPESTSTSTIESIISETTTITESTVEVIESTTTSAVASHVTDEGFASSVSSVAESIHSNAASIIESVSSKIHEATESNIAHVEL